MENESLWNDDDNDDGTKLTDEWPRNGEIVFEKVSFSYDKNLPVVLKNVTFKINSGEKIGIIGRSGAGKSR